MNIKIGDRVRIVDSQEFSMFNGLTAGVKRVYTEVDPPVAFIVKEDDGVGFKVPLANLAKIEETEQAAPEIPESAKKISRAAFEDAVDRMVMGRTLTGEGVRTHDLLSAIAPGIQLTKSAVQIFGENDYIVVTADQLIDLLYIECAPAKMVEGMGRSHADGIILSCTVLVYAEHVVEDLFRDSEGGK